MRDLRVHEAYRIAVGELGWIFGKPGSPTGGAFEFPYPKTGVTFHIIASSGDGWDHVSVSLQFRCPNWDEMEYVKRMFFKDDEVCWQYHVRPADHISHHPNCLHIWRKHDFEMPMPPKEMVG